MLNVELHNIVSEEEAYTQIRELVDRVARTRDTVVITRGGHPTVALIDVEKLDSLSGGTPAPQIQQMPQMTMPPVAPPVSLPDMPSMNTSPLAAINDSPMNEAIDVPASPMSAPIAEVVAPAPVVEPTAPIMPMPIQTTFGQDIPESSDPLNGSPLA